MTNTTSPPQPVDLAAILARTEAATPGPWQHQPYGPQNENGDHAGAEVFDARGEYLVHDVSDADGAFIAQARADVPALAAEVRRLREALAEVAKHQEDMADSLDDSITHEQIHEQLLVGMRLAVDARG